MTRTAAKAWRTGACLAGSLLLVAAAMAQGRADPAAQEPARAGKLVLWAHPPDVGRTPEEVEAFLARAARSGVDDILVLVKGMSGEIYWRSDRFQDSTAAAWKDVDLLELLVPRARKHKIGIHAWLVDFVEGQRSPVYRTNPHWAQLNPAGETTLSETLGVDRRPYPYVWMCPAQRPGYTDQWLLPMIEEIARKYDVAGIHHDYVRYPGDVAPDAYCFCDYCLANMPRHAMLQYEARASQRSRVRPVQERIEANWWSDPTVQPPDWEQRDRREKADFLLNGRTTPLGPPDMRYFFYDYRVHQIDRFVRESWDLVKKINPRLEISSAVFRNPVQSARYIGQQWHRWNPWTDFYTPMSYRSHFAGDFETYLERLEETTARQMEWIGRGRPLYAGIATIYLYREEQEPIDNLRDAAGRLHAAGADGEERAKAEAAVREGHRVLDRALRPVSADRSKEIAQLVEAALAPGAERASVEPLDKALAELRLRPPAGFYPPEKLTRAIAAAQRGKPDGIAIFSAGTLTREHLWPALEAASRELRR